MERHDSRSSGGPADAGPGTGTGPGPDADPGDITGVLTAVGPRLRALRRESGMTLAQLGESTGISVSTLSRLESGQRRPTLELLLPLARAHHVPLDELVGAPATGDPRIYPRPFNRHGQTIVPLTRHLGGMHAFKHIMPARTGQGAAVRPEQGTHEGYEWMYVLSGRLWLALGDHDLVLTAGEAAEFDTRTPHGFGNAGSAPVEFLSLYGAQGERMHVRARPSSPRERESTRGSARTPAREPAGGRAPDPARDPGRKPSPDPARGSARNAPHDVPRDAARGAGHGKSSPGQEG